MPPWEIRKPLSAAILSALLVAASPAAHAQEGVPIIWQEGVGVVGALMVGSQADQALQEYTRDNQTQFKSDVASVFRHMGQPEVFVTAGLGTLGIGLLTHNDKVARAGGRITASLLLAGAAATGLKLLAGRERPSTTTNAYIFKPFSGNESFPSGHATMAFALAASVADEVHRPWATGALYGAASLTAWSRIYDNQHWFSDVLAGAAVGITSAKLINGRWRVWHVRPPAILREPGGELGLLWTVGF